MTLQFFQSASKWSLGSILVSKLNLSRPMARFYNLKREIPFRGKIYRSYYIFLKTFLDTTKLGEHKKFGRALPPNDHTTCGSGLTLNTVEAAQSTWRRMHDARTGCALSKAHIYVYGANNVTGVSMACNLYFCFLALCEVSRTCPSGLRPQQYYMLFITNNHVAYFIKFHFFVLSVTLFCGN